MLYHQILADLIQYFHAAFILVVFLMPYQSNATVHRVYLYLLPMLFISWYLWDYKCGLTALESFMRGIPDKDGFIYQIVNPILRFQSQEKFNTSLNLYLVATWCLVLYRLN